MSEWKVMKRKELDQPGSPQRYPARDEAIPEAIPEANQERRSTRLTYLRVLH